MKTVSNLVAAGLMAVSSSGYASIVFLGTPEFVPNNTPMSSGAGTFVVEALPFGSGTGLSSPSSHPDGMSTGQGYGIKYIAAPADIGSSVLISWTADREFAATIGTIATFQVFLDAQFSILNPQGAGARVYLEAGTGRRLNGPDSAWLFSDFVLNATSGTRILSDVSSRSTVLQDPNDALRQNLLISFNPTVAGQELQVFFGTEGLRSTVVAGPPASVSTPRSLPLLLMALVAMAFLGGHRSFTAKA